MRAIVIIALMCCVGGTVVSASSVGRKVLQAKTCGIAAVDTVQVPEAALLYLSVRAEGNIAYACGSDGVPTFVSEEGTLTSPEGYSGTVFTNPDDFLQFDVQVSDPSFSVPVKNSIVAAKNPVLVANPGTLAFGRWNVQSTDGAKPDMGGLPGLAYVTREDMSGGNPPNGDKCKAGFNFSVPYVSTYNMYTCDPAYINEFPAASPTGAIDAAPPTVAPIVPIVPPIVLPAALSPSPESIPVAESPAAAVSPSPALAPIVAPVVAPVVVNTTTNAVPPPPSAAAPVTAGRMAMACCALMAAAFLI